ncbi:MAG: Cytosine/adenosine deaminase [Candidatus Electronema aureum]|uniref:Cytosine/adenosine deaminase n=1 Tax=Candidatus Electronema aureum TaxID=2005002 RepID=A0A521G1Q5_9BACT|nr:MAG: Cytosine/adenosine deaminase [Candidatus Electronema aureum]
MNPPLAVHRAPWLLPISQPPIADGGLVISNGKLLAVGRFRDIVRSHPGVAVIDHPDVLFLPGLINAHTHLELSHLAHLAKLPAPASFTEWIILLIAERAKAAGDPEAEGKRIATAARAVLAAQQQHGVVAIADISNTGLCSSLGNEFKGRLLCFSEYLRLRADAVNAALLRLHAEPDSNYCTGHAPYSTHVDLLRGLKARANRLGHVFPIHIAESSAEIELLRSGGGELRDFLEHRGLWDDTLPLGEGGAVNYLHRHGLLDRRTLCIHCVHIVGEEIDLLAKFGAKVCLCPGSNAYLGVDSAPVELLLRRGILPALGTDSLASNPELSIWREMRILAALHPALSPANLLAMATLGGANALGLADRLGTLEPSKDAAVLAIELRAPARTAGEVQEQLIQQGGGCRLHRL